MGFSWRYARPDKFPITIFEAYPEFLYLVTDKLLSRWKEAGAASGLDQSATDSGVAAAYRKYRESLHDIPEVEKLFNLGRTHAYHEKMTLDELRVLLAATNQLGEDLAALKLT